MTPLLRLMFRSFLRGGGAVALVVIPLVVYFVVRVVTGIDGVVSVNGETVPMDSASISAWALRIGLSFANVLIALVVLFLGLPLAVSGLEAGSARFDLTAPISRVRWLSIQTAGISLILLLLWTAAGFGAAAALRGVPATLLPAAGLLVLAHLLFVALAVAGSVAFGFRMGALLAIVIWGGAWVLSQDVVEAYLFDVTPPVEGFAGVWYAILSPYLDGAPAGPVATMLRFATRIFPPVANVQSVAFDLAAARPIFPDTDARSPLVAGIWCVVSWVLAARLLRGKDV